MGYLTVVAWLLFIFTNEGTITKLHKEVLEDGSKEFWAQAIPTFSELVDVGTYINIYIKDIYI